MGKKQGVKCRVEWGFAAVKVVLKGQLQEEEEGEGGGHRGWREDRKCHRINCNNEVKERNRQWRNALFKNTFNCHLN